MSNLFLTYSVNPTAPIPITLWPNQPSYYLRYRVCGSCSFYLAYFHRLTPPATLY